MTEQWRTIPGYEGYYEASDQGRIRRVAGGKGASIGRVLKLYIEKNGYGTVRLSRDNTNKKYTVHRLISLTFFGERLDGMTVNHKNGIKTDNRSCNLEYMTRSENSLHAHRVLKVRHAKGEDCNKSGLKSKDILTIFEKLAQGVQGKDIAGQYGVTNEAIYDIKYRRTWGHVEVPGEIVEAATAQKNRGIRHRNAKLNPSKIREIRQYLSSGHSIPKVAKMYNVAYGTIRQVKFGITWRHVD